MFRSIRITVKHNSTRRAVRPSTSTLAMLITTSALLLSAADSSAATHTAIAYAARTLNGTATAHLHLVRAEGSELIEEGSVSGALVGTARAELSTGAIFTASFTIHARGGSITGHGRATPHGSGRYQSFSGSFSATNGTGRYAHISGRAGLYGVFDRRTDSVVIQTTGTLTY
jgi:hypothetical protein